MSPDPPREDSGDDENRIRRFSGDFMEGVINDDEFFIVPDAPYEMDMEEESEYSDSDEEGVNAGVARANRLFATQISSITPHVESGATGAGDEQEFLFLEGQSRGRYRLLIPFPTPTIDDGATTGDANQTSSERQNADGSDGINQDTTSDNSVIRTENDDATIEKPSFSGNQSSGDNSSDKPSSSGCDEPKREIELTDEKVEKIKEVMKNITLPPTSIPKWASEIDEDAWRKKLNESISNNSCSSSRLTKRTDKSGQL